ncbi:MAG: hypothetical protein MJ209_07395 [archaeon]|nr:hypothetical protein [archaeon]
MPQDIVSDYDIEAKSIKDINFIYGLNDTYKESITQFMEIEVNLGLLNKVIPDDKLYFEF